MYTRQGEASAHPEPPEKPGTKVSAPPASKEADSYSLKCLCTHKTIPAKTTETVSVDQTVGKVQEEQLKPPTQR